jgi:hypothetical protein
MVHNVQDEDDELLLKTEDISFKIYETLDSWKDRATFAQLNKACNKIAHSSKSSSLVYDV